MNGRWIETGKKVVIRLQGNCAETVENVFV